MRCGILSDQKNKRWIFKEIDFIQIIGGFSAVLPKKDNIAGKKYTITIEQNDLNTRHYLGGMTRRTKVVSKSERMLDVAIKL